MANWSVQGRGKKICLFVLGPSIHELVRFCLTVFLVSARLGNEVAQIIRGISNQFPYSSSKNGISLNSIFGRVCHWFILIYLIFV